MASLTVLQFDRLCYAAAERLQAGLVARRKAGLCPDTLLLLEHDPVITLGRNAHRQNLLSSPAALQAAGIELAECDRGGDVTYHGPGQLVGYPILDLRQLSRPAASAGSRRIGLGPVDYVRALEEVLIGVAGDFGVPCRRIAGRTGVWTEADPPRKLAAIGVHVSRGIVSHGFALNVQKDLPGFAHIIPCGLADSAVTAIEFETGARPAMAAVRAGVVRWFGQIFGIEPVEKLGPDESLPALSAPVPSSGPALASTF